MKVYKNITALWQAPAGTINNAFHSGQALGIRLVPNATNGGNSGNYLPRTILVTDNVKRNNQITLGDSGWFLIDRDFLQIRDNDSDHPFARTVGPRASLAFGIEQAGSPLTDTWNVWVAEDLLDLLAGPAALIQMTRDSTSGLFFPLATSGGGGGLSVSINGNVGTAFNDAQVFDATAGAGAAITTGTIGNVGLHDYLVRVSGLSAPTTRTLTVNAIRTDLSVVPIFQSPAIGATVTDLVLAIGEGANLSTTVDGALSLGMNFSGPPPINLSVVLSAAGADTPRMTIWGRQQS